MPGNAESTVDDILRVLGRFRILCVGKAGVGKSSLINRVFGVQEALVADWKAGEAEIGKEITSKENPYFVLHDSKGFEAGITPTFELVADFIRERRNESLPLKDQLHAVWLCTEAPTAGAQLFEVGDENLLKVAHETQTPVVVVFTKYDYLVRSKQAELGEEGGGLNQQDLHERSREESQKVLHICVSSLQGAMTRLKAEMPRHQSVSILPGYEGNISSLVEITRDVVRETLKGDEWVLWAVAQRASLPPKIYPCAQIAMVYYKRCVMPSAVQVLLRDCLAEAHQAIITSWNFRDEERILISEQFKQLMRYLVQDDHESHNHGEGYDTHSPANDKVLQLLDPISTTSLTAPRLDTESVFADWLKDAALHNALQILRLLMTYIVELTAVLNSLFDIVRTRIPQSSGTISWLDLKKAFEAYKSSDSHRQIHHYISEVFQQDRQILDSDNFFQLIFLELIKVEGPQWPREGGQGRSQSARVPTSQPSAPQPSAPSPSPSRFRCPRRMRIPCLCPSLSTDHS